jgi:hypothetical protein
VIIRRPPTIRRRKFPPYRRGSRYPRGIRMFYLKIRSGGRATPDAPIHSIAVIHSCRPGICNDRYPVTCLRGSGQPCHGWARPRTMRFPYICNAPVTEAKRQRSVFASPAFLVAGWYTIRCYIPIRLFMYYYLSTTRPYSIFLNPRISSLLISTFEDKILLRANPDLSTLKTVSGG